jgi:acyl-CoA hydrolase
MEVGVKVEAESPLSNERVFVAHAYLTFVALSPRPTPHTYLGKQFIQYLPIAVPHIEPTTPMEKRRFDMAEERRQTRLLRRPNQPNRTAIRDTMRAYAQGLNLHQDQDAVIQSHPAFVPLADEASPFRHHQRRYSMDPKMLQPVKSMETEESFAEVVKLVMPQHANSLSITFGGQIISWMELCALSSANRLAKAYLLTAR